MLTYRKNQLITRTMAQQHRIFINRRRSRDRRQDRDPCKHMPLDLYHRKRRKAPERRAPGRSLEDDYYAFMGEKEKLSPH